MSPRIERLYDSHRACLKLVDEGLSSKEIAQQLHLSPSTVDSYMRDAISYFGVSNRRQAATKFRESGIASRPSTLRPQSLSVVSHPESAMIVPSYEPPPAKPGVGELRDAALSYRAETQATAAPRPDASGAQQRAQTALGTLHRIATLAAAITIVMSAAEPLGRGFEAIATLILHLRNE